MLSGLPSPKLGPRAMKEVLVPLSEYHVYENIPTDKVYDSSAVIQLGEEALTWQGISSDSESEGDYIATEMVYNEDMYGGYRSSNSLSDSDDDYMFGANKKKSKPKQNDPSLSVRSAAPRRGRLSKNRDLKDETYEPISLESFSNDMPPLLTDLEQGPPVLPQMPALIKTPDAVSDEPYSRSLHNASKASMTHVQPPSALIMPIKSEPSVRQGGSKLPGPPPLLKNNSNSEISADYPHIVLPPNTNQLMATSPVTTSPSPRRLGRPPKPKLAGGGTAKNKKSSAVRVTSNSSHYRPSTGSKGQSSSPYTGKGMKMTQYEFLSSSSTPSVHSIADSSPSQPNAVSYGSSSSLQNMMTPVQIIQGVQTTPVQVGNYQSVQPGGVVLMQGAHSMGLEYAPQQTSSYITQDGQTYQIIQAAQSPHLTMSDSGENSQKVSVIMQPPTAYTTKNTAGGLHYITQLDGTPPLAKTTNKATLKSRFEEGQRQEQAKLEATSVVVGTISGSSSTDIACSSSSTSEVNLEEKMSNRLDMYLAKTVTRSKPKQTTESVKATPLKGKAGRKHRSSSFVKHISGNETSKTHASHSGTKTTMKKSSTISSASTNLFQPDNIPTAIVAPETSLSAASVGLNSNHSNSNKQSSNTGDDKNDDDADSGNSTTPNKRSGEQDAAKSSSQASTSAKATTRGGRGRQPKKGATSKASATTTHKEAPSPITPEGTETGNSKETALNDTLTTKLGKRSRGRPCKQPQSTEDDKMDTTEVHNTSITESQLARDDVLPPIDSLPPSKKARGGKKTPAKTPSKPGPSSCGRKSTGLKKTPSKPGPSSCGRKSTGLKKPFQCDKCNAVYNSKKSLTNHIVCVHDTQLDVSSPTSKCESLYRKHAESLRTRMVHDASPISLDHLLTLLISV